MHARCLPIVLILFSFGLLLGACAPQQVVTAAPTLNAGLIGTISRVNDHVERGQSAANLIPVTAKDPLKAGDILQISKGGEGLLDFGNYLQLRVFNDTRLQTIALQHADNIPLYARIQLEEGGFTGELQKKAGKVVFDTPAGATITILGTQFWVIYSPADKAVGVGNFGGTISVTAQNVTRPVSSRHYVIVKAGQPPEPERPMTISRPDLEKMIRQQGSPANVMQTEFEGKATPTPSTPTATLTAVPTLALTVTQTLTTTPTLASTLACPPVLQVLRSAVCRVSPGTSKEVMNAFPAEMTMVPSKRTFSDPVWWNVPEPASGLSCWISGANLQVVGDASCVPVVGLVPGSALSVTATAVAQNYSPASSGNQSQPNNGGSSTGPSTATSPMPPPTLIKPTATLNPYP